MIANVPIAFVIMPETTYVMLERLSQVRRIYTDGRGWPVQLKASSLGLLDRQMDRRGRRRPLRHPRAETRGLKYPHVYDSSGTPFIRTSAPSSGAHPPRQDQSHLLRTRSPSSTTALTRPWTVTRSYPSRARLPMGRVRLPANNQHVVIGKEDYFLSADGLLMPVRRSETSRPAPLRSRAAIVLRGPRNTISSVR